MSRLHQKGGEPSQRMLRVAELIRHAMAELLSRGEINDPDLEGLVVTVPAVKMSPDLKLATIFVMPMGGRGRDRSSPTLEPHKKYLRGEIAQRDQPEIRARNPFPPMDSSEPEDAAVASTRCCTSPKVAELRRRRASRGKHE